MIQRIQTIFLFIALLLFVLMAFLPLATFNSMPGNIYTFSASGIKSSGDMDFQMNTIPLLAFIIVIALLYLVSIFIFKNRTAQMRICIFNMLLIVGMHGLFLFFLHLLKKDILISSVHYHVPAIFPILSLVLTYMAFRAIRKDEKLVKSYDRIR